MDLQPQNEQPDVKMITIDLTDISLEEIEQLDDSVLAQALRRIHHEAQVTADGITAHSSSSHASSYASCPW